MHVVNFMFFACFLQGVVFTVASSVFNTLKNRTEERHTEIENVLQYLHNYNDFKNEKVEKRQTKSNVIKFKTFYQQTYPHSEEFGTVIEDDDDTNIDSEKELSLEQKLELAIDKRNSTNQNTVQKSAISKTIRREIDLFEDEGFRGKYLGKERERESKSRITDCTIY
ncbi:uncharacterized protein TNCV_478311 [Trichonephila clavipes]|nr:uncharacterized protein TNCV_478311 [Trichonephila clavipes]